MNKTYLVYLAIIAPAIIFLFIRDVIIDVKERRRQREYIRNAERKAEAEREREAARHAARAARAAEKAAAASQAKRKRGRPCKQPQESPIAERPAIIPAPEPEPAPAAAPAAEPAKAHEPTPAAAPAKPVMPHGNNAFAGQVVAFTGRLPGMTRREAISAVERNGGRAYETMPAATTLLVVGDKPGMNKLDLADRWIASVRKITPAQFFEMIRQPITMEPDEFAAFIKARYAM